MADIVDLRTRQPMSHEDEFNSELVRTSPAFAKAW